MDRSDDSRVDGDGAPFVKTAPPTQPPKRGDGPAPDGDAGPPVGTALRARAVPLPLKPAAYHTQPLLPEPEVPSQRPIALASPASRGEEGGGTAAPEPAPSPMSFPSPNRPLPTAPAAWPKAIQLAAASSTANARAPSLGSATVAPRVAGPQAAWPKAGSQLQASATGFVPAAVPPMTADPLRRPEQFVPSQEEPSALRENAVTRNFSGKLRLAVRYVAYAVGGWLALVFALMVLYRFVNPPMSALMLQQALTGVEIEQSWVALDSISPQVVRAVLVSEDGRFCEHWGVDFEAMQDALESAGNGTPRGASTISMQVVKNLFLWPSKSYVRKAIELPLTGLMELFWSKRRIMEVYLNIAEWGPGIFGVEAASRYHFNKSARRLNELEAAQLAVALPNPYLRDAGDPGPKTRGLARDIQVRMRSAYRGQTACVLNGRR